MALEAFGEELNEATDGRGDRASAKAALSTSVKVAPPWYFAVFCQASSKAARSSSDMDSSTGLLAMTGVLLEASKVTGIIMLLIGMSGVLGWVLSFARLPQVVAESMLGLTENRVAIILIIMVVLLLAGAVMDPTPAILIFTPIFLPVVTALGISPIHFGAMMVFNMCLGNISPPIGNNLFVAARVGDVRLEALISKLWPFFWALVVGLFVVAFVPALSEWLPTTLGLMDLAPE